MESVSISLEKYDTSLLILLYFSPTVTKNAVEHAAVVFNHQHVNAIHLHRRMAVNIVLEIVFAIVRATPKIVPVIV